MKRNISYGGYVKGGEKSRTLDRQADTHGADFPYFSGGGVIVDLFHAMLADRLDRPHAHPLLVVVVVPFLLADEQLVAVTGEVRRRLDDVPRGRLRCGLLRGCLGGELVLLRQGGFLGFLSRFEQRELMFVVALPLSRYSTSKQANREFQASQAKVCVGGA